MLYGSYTLQMGSWPIFQNGDPYPRPLPSTLTLDPYPRPLPLTLTLDPYPPPLPLTLTLTLDPYPRPSPLTLILTLDPYPWPSSLPLTLTLDPHPYPWPLPLTLDPRFSNAALLHCPVHQHDCRHVRCKPLGLFRWKTLNKNDHNQVFWARETEHPQQTIVLTKTAGQQPGSGHCCLRSSFFDILKFSLKERFRGQRQESGWYVNIFHIHSNVFLLFLSSLPHYQAEYLIFRKWLFAAL